MPIEIKELVIRTFFGGMNYEGLKSSDKKSKNENGSDSHGGAMQGNSDTNQELKEELKKLLEHNQER